MREARPPERMGSGIQVSVFEGKEKAAGLGELWETQRSVKSLFSEYGVSFLRLRLADKARLLRRQTWLLTFLSSPLGGPAKGTLHVSFLWSDIETK